MRRVAPFVLVLIVAGCGGGTHRTSPPPKIPAALARTWSQQATQIAGALAANDGCTAQRLARTLESEFVSSIGRVPPRYRSTLGGALASLQDRIDCVRVVLTPTPHPHPEPKPKPPKHDDHHHHKDHG